MEPSEYNFPSFSLALFRETIFSVFDFSHIKTHESLEKLAYDPSSTKACSSILHRNTYISFYIPPKNTQRWIFYQNRFIFKLISFQYANCLSWTGEFSIRRNETTFSDAVLHDLSGVRTQQQALRQFFYKSSPSDSDWLTVAFCAAWWCCG